jgi:hypothetical protein
VSVFVGPFVSLSLSVSMCLCGCGSALGAVLAEALNTNFFW